MSGSPRANTGAMEKPKVLTAKELRTIMPRLSGWKLAQNKLSRTFEFQDFVQSLSFVNSLVAYFETVDYHPDVRIAYGEVTFELTRYDLGGKVTDRDVEVAKKISSLYRARATDVVGTVRERKEARECEQEQEGRKEREKELGRQLSRWTEDIVVDDLTPRATREFGPRNSMVLVGGVLTLSSGRRCWQFGQRIVAC